MTNVTVGAKALYDIKGALSTSTPGVVVVRPNGVYPDLTPYASAGSVEKYVLQFTPAYVPGTPIELSLAVTTRHGTATLLYTLPPVHPVSTPLLTETSANPA